MPRGSPDRHGTRPDGQRKLDAFIKNASFPISLLDAKALTPYSSAIWDEQLGVPGGGREAEPAQTTVCIRGRTLPPRRAGVGRFWQSRTWIWWQRKEEGSEPAQTVQADGITIASHSSLVPVRGIVKRADRARVRTLVHTANAGRNALAPGGQEE